MNKYEEFKLNYLENHGLYKIININILTFKLSFIFGQLRNLKI